VNIFLKTFPSQKQGKITMESIGICKAVRVSGIIDFSSEIHLFYSSTAGIALIVTGILKLRRGKKKST
jgi:hypothetical protein